MNKRLIVLAMSTLVIVSLCFAWSMLNLIYTGEFFFVEDGSIYRSLSNPSMGLVLMILLTIVGRADKEKFGYRARDRLYLAQGLSTWLVFATMAFGSGLLCWLTQFHRLNTTNVFVEQFAVWGVLITLGLSYCLYRFKPVWPQGLTWTVITER